MLSKNGRTQIYWTGLFLLLGVMLFFPPGCGKEKNAEAPPPVPEVATVTVQTQRVVLTNELPGRTSPYRVAEIRPQVSGIIQKRLFDEGADVKAGDVLYQIDPAPFQAAYDNAAANLAVVRKSCRPGAGRAASEYRRRHAAAGHPGARPDEPSDATRSCSRTEPSLPASATRP